MFQMAVALVHVFGPDKEKIGAFTLKLPVPASAMQIAKHIIKRYR